MDEKINSVNIKWLKDNVDEVKETIKELSQTVQKGFKDLDEKSTNGFKTTHEKQDYTNSRLSKVEARVDKVEDKQKIMWAIFGAIGITILGIIITRLGNLI